MIPLPSSYYDFLRVLDEDSGFAHKFLRHLWSLGYRFEGFAALSQISHLSTTEAIKLAKTLFPTYYLANCDAENESVN